MKKTLTLIATAIVTVVTATSCFASKPSDVSAPSYLEKEEVLCYDEDRMDVSQKPQDIGKDEGTKDATPPDVYWGCELPEFWNEGPKDATPPDIGEIVEIPVSPKPDNNEKLENNLSFYSVCQIAKQGGEVKGLTFDVDERIIEEVKGDIELRTIMVNVAKLNESVDLNDAFVKCEIDGEIYLMPEDDSSKIFRWNSVQFAEKYLNIVKEQTEIEGIEEAKDFFIYVS